MWQTLLGSLYLLLTVSLSGPYTCSASVIRHINLGYHNMQKCVLLWLGGHLLHPENPVFICYAGSVPHSKAHEAARCPSPLHHLREDMHLGSLPENFLLWLVWFLLYEQSREGSDLLGVGRPSTHYETKQNKNKNKNI